MSSSSASGGLHAAFTALLAAAILILVVSAAFGWVEIRLVGRPGHREPDRASLQPGSKAPPGVPQIARVPGSDALIKMLQSCFLVNQCQLFRYSGGFIDFELEVEIDGKKEVFGKSLGPTVRASAQPPGEGPSEGSDGPIEGHILWVQRHRPGQPLTEVSEAWDLAMSCRFRDGGPTTLGIRGIAVPPGAINENWVDGGIGARPVNVDREIVLWQRKLGGYPPDDKKRPAFVRLKCRPAAAGPSSVSRTTTTTGGDRLEARPSGR